MFTQKIVLRVNGTKLNIHIQLGLIFINEYLDRVSIVQIEDEEGPGGWLARVSLCPGARRRPLRWHLWRRAVSAQLGGRRQSRPSAEDPPRPRVPPRRPAGSAPSFSVLTWKTLTQHSFPGSPQRPLWGGRASSPESGHAGTQLGPGDVCGVAASRGAGRWPRAVNPAAAPQATGGRRVFAGDGWTGKRGRWLRPEPGVRGPRPRGCRTPSRRPARGERGLGRRPWRRPRVVVALRGARSSVSGGGLLCVGCRFSGTKWDCEYSCVSVPRSSFLELNSRA